MTQHLNELDPISLEHMQRVIAHLHERIESAGGWIPFDQFMQHALYAPGLGYYMAGSRKLAEADTPEARGDFITAPELTPVFGHTLAYPVGQVLRAVGSTDVLELGAGSGALAAQLVPALQEQGITVRYLILEVSADLRQRQQQKLARFGDAIQWLDTLPDTFTGCVLANEVLDAMPVKLFRWAENDTLLERGVTLRSHKTTARVGSAAATCSTASANAMTSTRSTASTRSPASSSASAGLTSGLASPSSPSSHSATTSVSAVTGDSAAALESEAYAFVWQDRPASAELEAAVRARMPCFPGYVSEINLQAEAFMRGLGAWLREGAALFIDYGFPRHEYYHPQRAEGTLMCHFRHQAHDNPLRLVGLQDITAHVDFTAMADAAFEAGLDVLGFTSQARFLLDAGLPAVLQTLRDVDEKAYTLGFNSVQKLISEAEMGELFKVLAVGRGLDSPPPGFSHDRLGSL